MYFNLLKAFADKNKLDLALSNNSIGAFNQSSNPKSSSLNKTTVSFKEFKTILFTSKQGLSEDIYKFSQNISFLSFSKIFESDIIINKCLRIDSAEMIEFIKQSFDFEQFNSANLINTIYNVNKDNATSSTIIYKPNVIVVDMAFYLILYYFKSKNQIRCRISSKFAININEVECTGCCKFTKFAADLNINICVNCGSSFCL